MGATPWVPEHLCHALKERRARNAAFERLQTARPSRPHDFVKPPFRSPEYWQAWGLGWISDTEAEADRLAYMARRKRALHAQFQAGFGQHPPPPNRHQQPAPRASRQYAQEMATTVQRDRRITDGAKALCTVIRARCGGDRCTVTTKGTLAAVMGRSPRTIQRYLAELVRFGYLEARLVTHITGMVVGLRLWITDAVLPFFRSGCRGQTRAKPGETGLSPTKSNLRDWTPGPTSHAPLKPLESVFARVRSPSNAMPQRC